VLSREYIKKVTMLGMALGCRINQASSFDRKHYFYHDSPAGYQITQKFNPIATQGHLLLSELDGIIGSRRIGVHQLQLEQDTAKSMVSADNQSTLIDYNRANCGLVEIVLDPDLRSSKEAVALIRKIALILRTLQVSEASMDDGTMRIDVNISLSDVNGGMTGCRTELKNLSSLRVIQDAISYEIERHQRLLEENPADLVSSTRGFDAETGQTFDLRLKETTTEYRYMPDPDLPLVRIADDEIRDWQDLLPELPDQQKQRLLKLGLSPYQTNILVEHEAVPVLDHCLSQPPTELRSRNPQNVANFLLNTVAGVLAPDPVSSLTSESSKLNISHVVSVYDSIETGHLYMHQAKQILEHCITQPTKTLSDILSAMGIAASPTKAHGEIQEAIEVVLRDNQKALADLKLGKVQVMTFLMGQVMRRLKGRAEPAQLHLLLKSRLESVPVSAEILASLKPPEHHEKSKKKR
jgi:aspartyl-tRNA(Asn)/glutamyl-tRNA(Gln) amidotransferase subunit B